MNVLLEDGEDLLVRQRPKTVGDVAFDNPGCISPGMIDFPESRVASSSFPKSV